MYIQGTDMLSTANLIVTYAVVFCGIIAVVWALSFLIKQAATELTEHYQKTAHNLTLGLYSWPLVALILGATFVLIEPILGAMILVPIAICIWAIIQPNVSRILERISLHWLVALSVYRVIGALFLYLYFSTGALSRGFALNAGWGDIITGVLAIMVAYMLWKRMRFAPFALLVWSIFGIIDLIGAPVSALVHGPQQLVTFPLCLIPIFLGPPFGLVLHIITLRSAWLQGQLPLQTALTQKGTAT